MRQILEEFSSVMLGILGVIFLLGVIYSCIGEEGILREMILFYLEGGA